MPLATVDDAPAWLRSVGAPPRLVQHHALVAEAAAELVGGLGACGYAFDSRLVLLGAALHDAGKLLHPCEMNGPGHRHEPAGHKLLRTHGLEWLAASRPTSTLWAPTIPRGCWERCADHPK